MQEKWELVQIKDNRKLLNVLNTPGRGTSPGNRGFNFQCTGHSCHSLLWN
jgi:hypothetical protein